MTKSGKEYFDFMFSEHNPLIGADEVRIERANIPIFLVRITSGCVCGRAVNFYGRYAVYRWNKGSKEILLASY